MRSEVLYVKDIMDILSISKNAAYDLIKEGLFPVVKVKSVYRIPKAPFMRWLHTCGVA